MQRRYSFKDEKNASSLNRPNQIRMQNFIWSNTHSRQEDLKEEGGVVGLRCWERVFINSQSAKREMSLSWKIAVNRID